jgi:hypothetical protein
MIYITHLRTKGLALTNGHGRYITVTSERTHVPVVTGMGLEYYGWKYVRAAMDVR